MKDRNWFLEQAKNLKATYDKVMVDDQKARDAYFNGEDDSEYSAIDFVFIPQSIHDIIIRFIHLVYAYDPMLPLNKDIDCRSR